MQKRPNEYLELPVFYFSNSFKLQTVHEYICFTLTSIKVPDWTVSQIFGFVSKNSDRFEEYFLRWHSTRTFDVENKVVPLSTQLDFSVELLMSEHLS